jgi:hypothetical protein
MGHLSPGESFLRAYSRRTGITPEKSKVRLGSGTHRVICAADFIRKAEVKFGTYALKPCNCS